MAGLAGITAASYLLFARFHLWLGPALFYFMTAYVLLAAYLLKLAAARQLDVGYASLAGHFAGSGDLEAAAGKKGLIGLFTRNGINEKNQRTPGDRVVLRGNAGGGGLAENARAWRKPCRWSDG